MAYEKGQGGGVRQCRLWSRFWGLGGGFQLYIEWLGCLKGRDI